MKNKLLIFSIIFFPLLIIFYPFLFDKQIFANGDVVLQYYPYWSFFQENFFINYQVPFWQSNMLAGYPLYASLVGGFFYPLNWLLFKLFSFISAYNWLIFIDFLLLGFSTYWLGRVLKLLRIPSLIVALTFVFSQFIFSFEGNIIICHFYFILPILFLSIYKIYYKKYKYILLGGFCLGIGWLIGQLQFIIYIITATFFFALFLDWLNWNNIKRWFNQGKVIKSFILIILISLIIGSFQLISTYELIEISNRTDLTYSQANVNSLNIADLFNFILPNFNLPYFGSSGNILYISFLSLFFALIAIFYYIKKNKFILFFSFLFLFSLIASFKYSPIFWLLHQLPVFESFRVPSRWMFLGIFSLSILAGFGCQFLYLEKIKEKFTKILRLIKYLVLVIILLIFISTIISNIYGEKIISLIQNKIVTEQFLQTHHLSEEHYLNIIQISISQAFNNFNLLDIKIWLPIIFAIFSIIIIGLYLKNKIDKNKFLIISLLLIIFSGLLIFGRSFDSLPDEFLLNQPKTVQFIKSQGDTESFRIYSLFGGLSEFTKLSSPYNSSFLESIDFNKEMINPNLNILYNIDSIDGYDNLMPKRHSRLLAYLGSERSTFGEKLVDEKITIEEKISKFLSRLSLLSMSNVKYIISSDKLNNQKLRLVFNTKTTSYKIPVYIYENLDMIPRIYFAKNVKFIDKDEVKNFNLLINPEIDFNKTTFIECSQCEDNLIENDSFLEINIEEYKKGLLKLKVNIEESKWLVFSESNLSAWQATIDVRLTKIYTANYLFQAIEVPAGEHEIKFRYQGVLDYNNLKSIW